MKVIINNILFFEDREKRRGFFFVNLNVCLVVLIRNILYYNISAFIFFEGSMEKSIYEFIFSVVMKYVYFFSFVFKYNLSVKKIELELIFNK